MKRKTFALTAIAAAIAIPMIVWAAPGIELEGRPEFKPASATGAFVWQEGSWFNVRFTSVVGPVRYHGDICVAGSINSVGSVVLEQGDSISVAQDGRCLSFSFMNNRHIDGFKFKTKSKKIEFELNLNTDPLDPEQVWIGRDGAHPEDTPFVIQVDERTALPLFRSTSRR
jgi:hypothetical protein